MVPDARSRATPVRHVGLGPAPPRGDVPFGDMTAEREAARAATRARRERTRGRRAARGRAGTLAGGRPGSAGAAIPRARHDRGRGRPRRRRGRAQPRAGRSRPGQRLEALVRPAGAASPGACAAIGRSASDAGAIVLFATRPLIVVSKPPGLPTHATADPARPHLVGHVRAPARVRGTGAVRRGAPAAGPGHVGPGALRDRPVGERGAGARLRRAGRWRRCTSRSRRARADAAAASFRVAVPLAATEGGRRVARGRP